MREEKQKERLIEGKKKGVSERLREIFIIYNNNNNNNSNNSNHHHHRKAKQRKRFFKSIYLFTIINYNNNTNNISNNPNISNNLNKIKINNKFSYSCCCY